MIQKIDEVGPLTFPKCQGKMKIISFSEDKEIIEKILKHLGLWEVKVKLPPKVKGSSVMISIDDSDLRFHFLPLPSIQTGDTR